MDNKIIMEPIYKIREIARKALEGNWKEMYIGMLLYFVTVPVVKIFLDHFFSYVEYIPMYDGTFMQLDISYASGIYEFVVIGAFTCGLAMFTLAFFRARQINYGLIFEGFSSFGKCFWLYLLYSIKIALWSLLFVIPGIIAAIRYSQAFFLRVDHPEWKASMCIKESCRLMVGNKAKFFGLQLSFIGWYMLAMLPSIIIELFDMSEFAMILFSIILSLPVIIVDLYLHISNTAFYELLNGNLVTVRENNEELF